MSSNIVPRFLWDPAMIEVVEDAFERVQVSPSTITGEQLHSALRSIRVQLTEWSGKLISPWTAERQTFDLTRGQESILLPVGTVAVSEGYYREPASGTDTSLALISRDTWNQIPDKSIVGDRPTHLFVNKQHRVGGPRQYEAFMWQRPGQENGMISLNLMLTLQDPSGVGDTLEIPTTWIPAMTAKLAWRLAEKFRPDVAREKERLANDAEEIALGSTADRAPFTMVFPTMRRYG